MGQANQLARILQAPQARERQLGAEVGERAKVEIFQPLL